MESEQKNAVVDFRVKSVIIKGILCVAFAGRVSDIEEIYEQVIDFFTHRTPNISTLDEFYHQMDHSPAVQILFTLGGPEFSDNKVMAAMYGDNWHQDHSIEKLDIVACGTGDSEWTRELVQLQGYLESLGDAAEDCRQRALLCP